MEGTRLFLVIFDSNSLSVLADISKEGNLIELIGQIGINLAPEIWSAIIALTGVAAGILVGYLGTRRNLLAQYDIDLRSKRIVAYKDLWQELKLLRKHDPPSPISYGEVKALITKCTTWYYDNGNGMYLTEMSRKTFFAFLGNLQKTVENKKDVDSVHMDYLGEHSDKEKNVKGSGLRNDASILRTVLLKDIGTRKEPHLDFGNKISRFKIKEGLKINGITIKETTSPEVPSNKTGHP